MLILNIGGSINAGKSTVSKLLSEKLSNCIFIEVDNLLTKEERNAIPDLKSRINAYLEKLYDKLTLLLNKKNIDVIIFACPMTKQCYENIKKITKGKALFKIITLNPDISICQTNRGSREITESKRLRILKMYKKGINKFKNSDLILDNTYQTPKETVNTIIKFLKTLNNSEE